MIFTALLMLLNHASWATPMAYGHLWWTIIVDLMAWGMAFKKG